MQYLKCIIIQEMKAIFKKHEIALGFPQNATNGSTVTDYDYWYNRITFNDSDLRRFVELIKSDEYNKLYEVCASGTGGSVDIYKL